MRVDRDGAYADRVLDAALKRAGLERRDRALATELSYGALRQRGRLDAALRQVLDRELARVELAVRNLLRLGAYQLLLLRRVRPATVVDETVKLARQVGVNRARGFVNAVLRRLADRRGKLAFPVLEQDPLGHLEQVGSLPGWIAERWLTELGPGDAAALAQTQTAPPPRTIRLSPGANRAAIQKRLGGRPCAYAPDGLTALARDPVPDRGFWRGEFTVQDEASQLVALLVAAQPGETVVDCCAAPGTKSVQLAQQVGPGGEVIALELHASRLPLIGRAAKRLRLENLRILERDVIQGFDLQGRVRFPRILVDAPCSGLGVLRRNPDARWRLSPGDVALAAEAQYRLLGSAARYVEPGGVLVYSVCTLTPEETSGVTERFLLEQLGFRCDDPRPFLPPAAKDLVDPSGALRTWPHLHEMDGFYAVRLVRT